MTAPDHHRALTRIAELTTIPDGMTEDFVWLQTAISMANIVAQAALTGPYISAEPVTDLAESEHEDIEAACKRATYVAAIAAAPPADAVRAPYAYIRRSYGVTPTPGQRVRHQITHRYGVIVRPHDDPHYVQVRFDGQKHSTPCHPTELDYLL